MNKNEIKAEIFKLKLNLKKSDYKTLKFIEGKLSQDEFENVKLERQKIREKINELENQLNVLSIE